MNYLSLYFLLKTGLFYTHYIGFNWWLNLLLALLVFWPLQAGPLERTRRLLAWPLALALLYHDSFLPDATRVWSQLGALSGFSLAYMLELLRRVVSPTALVGLAVLALAYTALSRWLRFSTLALVGILSVPLVAALGNGTTGTGAMPAIAASSPANTAPDQDALLQAFYRSEHQRKLVFPTSVGKPAFDLIVLHVCSLSWDDLDFVNQRNAPLLKRFDVVFSRFNSAASYSGPATFRMFRGNCGQTSHDQLYKGVDDSCYTFPALRAAGFQTSGLLNHDGIYDRFGKIVDEEAGLNGQFESNRGAPVHLQSFDGSPIYDDLGLLSQWWAQRQTRGSAPVALYYNTITLHDGNRVPGGKTRSSLDTYQPRLLKLLGDFDRFVTQLEASGRSVVLVLLPEHGASLRGDKVQISGMREIPDPKITLVPAAIKLIGMPTATATAGPVVVTQDMSYFGINALLADLLRENPFATGGRPLAERLEALETTPFVAENDDVVMMGSDNGYVLKSTEGTWVNFGKP